jgi:hypothetical protein
MPVISVFTGEDKGQRLGFIAENLDFYKRLGKKTVLLASRDTFGLAKDGYVLASGYVEDVPVDFAMEALYAIGDTNKGAKFLSKILVTEEEMRNAKEPFWERCARNIIESVAKTAAKAEAFARKNTQPPYVSLSSRMGRIMADAAEKKYSKSKETYWWEKFEDGTINLLIYNNAPNTAAGIISVTQSHLDVLCRISASERAPLLKDDEKTIVIYGPAYDEDELRAIFSVLSLRFKDAVFFFPEAQEYRSLISKLDVDAICSSDVPMTDPATKSVIFGRQSVTPFFKSKVYETTGFERLTFLEYETPDALPPGEAIALMNSKWRIVKVPCIRIEPEEPKLSYEEKDETIKDLLRATPKTVKEQETEREQFITEEDLDKYGLEILTDDFIWDLEELENDDEDQ